MKFLPWLLIAFYCTTAFTQQKDSNGSGVITLLCDNKQNNPINLKIDLKNELFWMSEKSTVMYMAEPIAYFNENKVQLTKIFSVDRMNGTFNISAISNSPGMTYPCSRAPFPEVARKF